MFFFQFSSIKALLHQVWAIFYDILFVCVCHWQVTKSKVCINFSVFRRYKVARVQDAVVQVYDYYEPSGWS